MAMPGEQVDSVPRIDLILGLQEHRHRDAKVTIGDVADLVTDDEFEFPQLQVLDGRRR